MQAADAFEAPESPLRRWGKLALLILAVLLLLMANVAYWVQHSLLDSDEFTSEVSGVLSQPEAADRIGEVLANQALASGVIQQRVEEALPENAAFLVVAAEQPLAEIIQRTLSRIILLQSTQDVLDAAVRRMHSLLVNTLEARSESSAQGTGQIIIDLNVVVQRFLDRLGVDLPQGGADVDLGTVVLVEDADLLDDASRLVRIINESVPILFGATLLAFAGVVLLSRKVSSGLVPVGYAVIVGAVILLLAWRFGNWAAFSFLDERPIARMMAESLTDNLRTQALVFLAIGACLVVLFEDRIRTRITGAYDAVMSRTGSLAGGHVLLLGAAALVVLLLLL